MGAENTDILHGLLEHVSHTTLTIGNAGIQRQGVDFVCRELDSQKDIADLWAVAMRENEIVVLLQQRQQIPASSFRIRSGAYRLVDGSRSHQTKPYKDRLH